MGVSSNVTSYQKYYQPDERSGICVIKRKGESDEELLKRFRKKYTKSGIAKELRDRMYFEKPSAKKKRKRMQSIRMLQREQEKIEEQQVKYEKSKNKQRKFRDRKDRDYDSGSGRQHYSSVYESDED
jgi:small subunit ribosomal protein S21